MVRGRVVYERDPGGSDPRGGADDAPAGRGDDDERHHDVQGQNVRV
jgi:hypothetical protein